jgi:transposase
MDKAPAPVFVGIDVAKHSLDVHLRPFGERFAIDHDEQGVTALVGRLAALAPAPALIVLEATGGMEVRLPCRARAAGAWSAVNRKRGGPSCVVGPRGCSRSPCSRR